MLCMHKLSRCCLTNKQGVFRNTIRNIITLNAEYLTSQASRNSEPDTTNIRIFGANAVKAALIARKRKFHYLYVYGDSPGKQNILRLARKAAVDIVTVDNKGVLNDMADNRPHNGVVLECSDLVRTNISALGTCEDEWLPILQNYDVMSSEKTVAKHDAIGTTRAVYLLLDEVTDPQNVGSIIRTAYFLGVRGLIMSARNCASVTPVVIKAASGATEFLPLYYIDSTASFIRTTRKNGWICCATVGPRDAFNDNRRVSTEDLRALSKSKPILLIFGSEGAGLRTLIKNECSKLLTVPAIGEVHPAVDSLNVSVAVGVILGAVTVSH